jgi:hypothetical protein
MAVVTCACRDCFEITYAAETVNTPTLCEECEQAGCEIYPGEPSDGSWIGKRQWDCQRDDAYDTREYEP